MTITGALSGTSCFGLRATNLRFSSLSAGGWLDHKVLEFLHDLLSRLISSPLSHDTGAAVRNTGELHKVIGSRANEEGLTPRQPFLVRPG